MRRLVVALVLALCLSLSGCFGGFKLTKKVHDFNGNVSKSKVVKEVVFLVLVFVPVYGFSIFLDAILFNTIELFTDENPID